MKTLFYFKDEDSEVCYPEDYFTALLDDSVMEMEVYEAIPEKIKGIFWCKEKQFCGDGTGDYCGKQCRFYKPRNGKSGCCVHHSSRLYTHGNKTILKRK